MTQKSTSTEVWDSLTLDLVSIQVEGKIVFINKAGAKMLGAVTPEQLVGKSILDFVHPDYQEIALDRECQMINGDIVICPGKEKWIRLDGKSIDVEVAAVPLVYQGWPAMQFIVRCDGSASGPRKSMRTCSTAARLRGKHPR
jgi:PAS domain S-box-containing protein